MQITKPPELSMPTARKTLRGAVPHLHWKKRHRATPPGHEFTSKWRLSSSDEPQHADDEGGLALQEARPKLKRPSLYKVVLLNDDYTPMEFVVEVLEVFFKMNREQATQVMLAVHTLGKGVCGIYTKDIAETKSAQVNQYARDHQHPLLCEIEASED